MAHPAKLLTLPRAARLNPCPPSSSRCRNAFDFCEASGTTLTNVGVDPLTLSEHPSLGNGTLSGTPTFVGTGADAPHIVFDVAEGDNPHAQFTPAASVTLARGTLSMRFALGDDTSSHQLFNNGLAITTIGRFTLVALANKVTLQIRVSGVVYIWDIVDTDELLATGAPANLVLWWGGPGGIGGHLQVNGGTARMPLVVSPNTGTPEGWAGGWVVSTDFLCRIGASRTGVTAGALSVMAFSIHDVALYVPGRRNLEVESTLNDGYLVFRRVPSVDGELCLNTPMAAPINDSSAQLVFKAGLGYDATGELDYDHVWVRARHAATPLLLKDATYTTPGNDQKAGLTDVRKHMPILFTGLPGLESAAEYYDWQWSTDEGVTWNSMPCPMGWWGGGPIDLWADEHAGVLTEFDPETDGFGLTLWAGSTAGQFRLWQACQDAYVRGTQGLHISLGDFLMCYDNLGASGTADVSYGAMRGAASAWNRTALRTLSGGLLCAPGNHELPGGTLGGGGNYHNDSGKASFKACLRTFIEFSACNPTNGEQEGTPDDGGDFDWMPLLSEQDAAWRATYLIPDLDPWPNSLPPAPWRMRNYWYFDWDGVRFIAGDPTTYSQIGTETGWHYGPSQVVWRLSAMAAAVATGLRIVELQHQDLASSEGEYRPACGYFAGQTDNAETVALYADLVDYGANLVARGHNHTAALNIHPVTGLNYLLVPSPQMVSFGVVSNVPEAFENIGSMIGLREDNGATLLNGAVGSGTAIGNVFRQHVAGYACLVWTETTMEVGIRQTSVVYQGFDETPGWDVPYANLDLAASGTRQIGPECAVADGAVTLSEIPTDVAFAMLASGVTGDWWSLTENPTLYSAGDVKAADPLGAFMAWEDHLSAVVAVGAGATGPVHVLAVPREWQTATLNKASLGGDGSGDGNDVTLDGFRASDPIHNEAKI